MTQADIQDGQYVDLSLNPERFTGYAGPSAHHVWQTIYEENCFGLSEASLDTTQVSEKQGMAMAAGFSSSGSGSAGGPGLSHGWGTDMVKSTPEGEMCEEKKVYYRVISGQLAKSAKKPLSADAQVYMPRSRYIYVTSTSTSRQVFGRQIYNASLIAWRPTQNDYPTSTSTLFYSSERSLGQHHILRHTISESLHPAGISMREGWN